MQKDVKDFADLERMLELSRLEQIPTADQMKEFSVLKARLERRMKQTFTLEERTRRLVRYLKAA